MLQVFNQVLEPIVIVDDDRDAADTVQLQLEMFGAETIDIVDPPSNSSLDAMLATTEPYKLLLCDHKLNQRFKVDYFGAELAAAAAKRGQPSVLMTGQLPNEMARIRRRLAEIPGFWTREEGTPSLEPQIAAAAAMLAGEPLSASRYFRAMVEVVGWTASVGGPLATVRVYGWVHEGTIDIPIELLGSLAERGIDLVGEALTAEVNLLESNPNRLRFKNPSADIIEGDYLLQDRQ